MSSGISKVVDKQFVKYSFYEANQDFQTIYVDYGRRQGCEMINIKNGLGLAVPDIPLYDPTCFQPIQEASSSLFLVITSKSWTFFLDV